MCDKTLAARIEPYSVDPSRRPEHSGTGLGRRTELLLFAAVFLGVAGAHIWMGWMAPTALSFNTDHVHTDNAVMLLMGKHMLEKGEFPIFYYGQNWFGSLSAMVHAGVFLVLGGIPPWSIHVAPLLFFLGFCLVLYLLTRATLGPAVALFALAWTIVTPVSLSVYSVMPHGGYVEGLMLGTVLLWLSVRLVRTRGLGWKRGQYALLGFVGGVGWWTSPLVIYQLLASAAYVVLREGFPGVLRGAILSTPSFFIGAAPFFYFYAIDPHSNVLSMGGGHALSHIPGGLYFLFFQRVPQYLDWDLFRATIPFTHWLAAVVYGWALLYLLWRLRKAFSTWHPLKDAAIFPISFLISALVLAASVHVRRSAAGYVMPLSALFPVAVGFWLVHSSRAWKVAVGVGYAAVFLLHGWTTGSLVIKEAPRAELQTQGYVDLVRSLEAKGVRRVYLHSTPGSELLNFYARERVIASQATAERYDPNFRALEREPDPAFLYPRRDRRLTSTLKALGASYETEQVGEYDLVRHVRTTDRRYRQIPVTRLHGSASHGAQALRYALDRDMESSWTSVETKRPGMWVQFDLAGRFNVGLVRLWNKGEHHGSYAMNVRVQTSVDGRVWEEVIPRSPMEYLYGSGPRVYPWEWGYRWEARFTPVEARFVRITQYEEDARFPWIIAEAYVYEDLGARESADAGDQGVVARIGDVRLRRVYADRWMTAKIAESSQDRIETVTPFTIAIAEFYDRVKSRVIQWSGQTGFVLEDSDADEFQRMMTAEGLHHLAREDIGRWVLFHFQGPAATVDVREGDPGWWWNGLGAVTVDRKEKSRYLATVAQMMYEDGRLDRALVLARRAVDVYRFNSTARQVLIRTLGKLGRTGEGAEQFRLLKDLTEPEVKTSVEFQKTLEFRGYTLSSASAQPGGEVGIRYFWKVKGDPGPRHAITVFVHIESAEGRFQGDYQLLGGHERPLWPVLEHEIVIQDEWIRVPAHTVPGVYQILLGVYDRATGRKWPVSASESVEDRGRALVGVLRVEPKEGR